MARFNLSPKTKKLAQNNKVLSKHPPNPIPKHKPSKSSDSHSAHSRLNFNSNISNDSTSKSYRRPNSSLRYSETSRFTATNVVVNSRLSTVQTRKISKTQSAKWKSIQPEFLNFILSLLEDSLARFSRPGNKEVMRTHKKIRTTFVRELKSAKVPAEKYIDVKAMKFAEETLLAEKKRLDQLQLKLSSALKKEEKLTKQLQMDVTIDAAPLHEDEEYHPILKNIL